MKELLEVEVDQCHSAFIQAARAQYGIADEGKVVRIILDFVLSSPQLHEAIFTEVRCLRCE
ncbi:MAG: hypothetical protein FJ316_12340 [SAR202 cluster bacterium]|nr:hypothetical protein [SAR202 cluster bacterium]